MVALSGSLELLLEGLSLGDLGLLHLVEVGTVSLHESESLDRVDLLGVLADLLAELEDLLRGGLGLLDLLGGGGNLLDGSRSGLLGGGSLLGGGGGLLDGGGGLGLLLLGGHFCFLG